MNTESSDKRRYLAAFLPLLPAERIAPRAPDGPYALIEKQKSALRLVALDARALALGLEPGLTLADARARVPELAVFDHDPAADVKLLEWLADACERYTPMAATDPPRGLILDITGCAHPFKGEAGLMRDLNRRLSRLGLTTRLAPGDTPDIALALAQYGGNDIRALPVTALRVESETHLALRRAGLKTIGALADRPRGPLAARFGEKLPVLIARLLGEQDPRITPRRALPEILVETRFAEPFTQSEALLGVLEQLARETAQMLARRGAGGRRFEASLFRADGHVARLGVETGQAVREPAVVMRLFRERIEALSDPLDPGFGYDMVRLIVPVSEPLAPEQLRLEGGTIAEAEIAALVDRLSTRLGRRRVRRFRAGDSHIPEQAAFELPAQSVPVAGDWRQPTPGEPPLRPLHLLNPPQPIRVMAEVPDGPPRQFTWRRRTHVMMRYEGPERIASEWWRRKDGHHPGQGGLTRDYYRIEDTEGRRFWLFRHGLYASEKPDPDWYLHGLFA